MTTPLEKTVRRAVKIHGKDYVVALSPENLKLTLKGHRIGVELNWNDLVSGEAALATALQASLGRFADERTAPPAVSKRVRAATRGKNSRKDAKR